MPPRKAKPEQLYLEGTAPPRDEDIEAKLEAWHDALDARTGASEDAKLCHLVLLATLQERGVKAYPYRDRGTGEKRVIKIKAGEPKVTTAKAPKPERVDREKDMAGAGSAADRVRDADRALDAFANAVDKITSKGHKVTVNGVEVKPPIDEDSDPYPSERERKRAAKLEREQERAEFAGAESAHAERINADADPFASTRAAMTPAQVAVAESEAARERRRNGGAP